MLIRRYLYPNDTLPSEQRGADLSGVEAFEVYTFVIQCTPLPPHAVFS